MKELSSKNFATLKEKTACFTGHRPQKLPWGFNEQDTRCIAMKAQLINHIENCIKNGYENFWCGMALGFDMICEETVIQLKKSYPHIKLMGAIPCRNQDCKWSQKDKLRYRNLLSKLDGERCIYENYNGRICMLERNKFMVDNSSMIIALFNGEEGGTKGTIQYAKQKNLKTIIIQP